MTFGEYIGAPVDTLPNSYLRWLITKDIPLDIQIAAKEKLERSSHSQQFIEISRHALDQFSIYFLSKWLSYVNGRELIVVDSIVNGMPQARKTEYDGIGTFISKKAQEAWDHGEDVSKHRHHNDGVVRLHKGVKWVFGVNQRFPEYRTVITVMPDED